MRELLVDARAAAKSYAIDLIFHHVMQFVFRQVIACFSLSCIELYASMYMAYRFEYYNSHFHTLAVPTSRRKLYFYCYIIF